MACAVSMGGHWQLRASSPEMDMEKRSLKNGTIVLQLISMGMGGEMRE